ncbi:hypothetical protein [Natronoarchaeum rubrum]|uniref:hypothetical protein n=1 Tax=Natronoarchaeum rubrum TaxID=755311 RepID=UPI0021112E86|nr:hypothetical protein [Natronoarchaeum rubrum]
MESPVEALLTVHEGEHVELEAEQYEWASPFEVAAIDEDEWQAPTGDVWRSRSVELEPGHPAGSARTFDVYEGGPAPHVGPAYGRLVEASHVLNEDPETPSEDSEDLDHPDWLARDGRDIVADSPVPRTLAEVLNTVERQDSLLNVHRRLASTRMKQTKDLLWQLGLRGQTGQLLEDDLLQEHIDELREVYVDE